MACVNNFAEVLEQTCNFVLRHPERTDHIERKQSFLPSRSAGLLICMVVELSVWRQIHFPASIHLTVLQIPEKTQRNLIKLHQ